ISFLPVFMLTGRDYKLFAPLAWTKTFSLIAALIVAVTLVPLFSRMFLSSSKLGWRGRSIGAVGFALTGVLLGMMFGEVLTEVFNLPLPLIVLVAALIGGVAGFWLLGEQLRPVDKNPVSRTILRLYEPALRFFLARKGLF